MSIGLFILAVNLVSVKLPGTVGISSCPACKKIDLLKSNCFLGGKPDYCLNKSGEFFAASKPYLTSPKMGVENA